MRLALAVALKLSIAAAPRVVQIASLSLTRRLCTA